MFHQVFICNKPRETGFVEELEEVDNDFNASFPPFSEEETTNNMKEELNCMELENECEESKKPIIKELCKSIKNEIKSEQLYNELKPKPEVITECLLDEDDCKKPFLCKDFNKVHKEENVTKPFEMFDNNYCLGESCAKEECQKTYNSNQHTFDKDVLLGVETPNSNYKNVLEIGKCDEKMSKPLIVAVSNHEGEIITPDLINVNSCLSVKTEVGEVASNSVTNTNKISQETSQEQEDRGSKIIKRKNVENIEFCKKKKIISQKEEDSGSDWEQEYWSAKAVKYTKKTSATNITTDFKRLKTYNNCETPMLKKNQEPNTAIGLLPRSTEVNREYHNESANIAQSNISNVRKLLKDKQLVRTVPKPKNIFLKPTVEESNVPENNFLKTKQNFISDVECPKCNRMFPSRLSMEKHQSRTLCGGYRRPKRLKCSICGKPYRKRDQLLSHENSHTKARPYQCPVCDKRFGSMACLSSHHKNLHLNIRTIFLCCYCGLTTKNYTHLLAHEEVHLLPEGAPIPTPFKCECGKGFISKHLLSLHQKEHKRSKLRCSTCLKKFSSEEALKTHLESDSHEKKHKCRNCEKSFFNKAALVLHYQSHSNVPKFFCDICDKGFKSKPHIRQHLITHSDSRPISCTECNETFKRPTHLKQHMAAIHEKGKRR